MIGKGIWRRGRPDPAEGLGDLEAALRQEGCPVCAHAAGADERWLDHFLYEGYQEPEPMAAVARSGGFCSRHARRVEGMGTSAAVALIYLTLIRDLLPPLAAQGARRPPLIAVPGACEACAQGREVERRDSFFLALLIRARGSAVYGNPGIVCAPHLPRLIEYLDPGALAEVVAVHRRAAAAVTASLADSTRQCGATADRAIRTMLGPPKRPAAAPDAEIDAFGAGSDPVQRMYRRLRHLDGCAICAEIGDAAVQWLDWLAQAPAVDNDLGDVLPLCREHVWQARRAGGSLLARTLVENVTREAEERLVYAERGLDQAMGSPGLVASVRRAVFRSSPRAAVLAALRQGRECPLCRHLREVGERAVLLLAALLESADGRRAFESGYGLCVRHAAQALALPQASAAGGVVSSTMHARLAVLRWELEEQLRRGAWQMRPARRGAESSAWLNAGRRFAGHGG
jgi:hypothetical protein